jgi:hypothetical protein
LSNKRLETFQKGRRSGSSPHLAGKTNSQGTTAKRGAMAGFEAYRCMTKLVSEDISNPKRIRQ